MRKHQGFTLIELLVVISIIGTLATLSVVSLNGARAKARDARRVSDVRQIQTALELYYFDHDGYPTTSATLGINDSGCLGYGGFGVRGASCTSPYMGYVPSNPSPNGAPYVYEGIGGSGYTITFTLESGAGGLSPNGHTADQDGVQ
jgi:type II secretion system protein G